MAKVLSSTPDQYICVSLLFFLFAIPKDLYFRSTQANSNNSSNENSRGTTKWAIIGLYMGTNIIYFTPVSYTYFDVVVCRLPKRNAHISTSQL